MRECIPNSKAKNHEIFCFSSMMVLQWRERETKMWIGKCKVAWFLNKNQGIAFCISFGVLGA